MAEQRSSATLEAPSTSAATAGGSGVRAPPGTGGKAPMHSLAGGKARMHSPEPTQPPGPPPISPEERILETKNRVQNRVQITIDRADLHRRTPSTNSIRWTFEPAVTYGRPYRARPEDVLR